jgi:hypothetical protein
MLDTLEKAAFDAHVGEEFKLQLADGDSLVLKLAETDTLSGATAASDQRSPFSLTFIGPADRWVEQQTHTLEHPQMGTLQMFLVPLGPDTRGMRYEAIFT